MNELRPVKEDVQEIDLLDLFLFYWSKKWVLLLALLAGAVIAGIFTKTRIDPTYQATSVLYVYNSNKGAVDLSSLQLSTNLTNDYVELIKSRPVVETVVANLNKDYEYRQALNMVSVTNPNSTRFLRITITSTDPQEAMDMSNEFASVTRQQIAAIMDQQEPSMVEYGVYPTEPVAPSMSRNVLIGGLLALILVMGIYLLLYLLDDTIKSSDDIEKYLESNTLAVIPLRSGEKRENRGIRSVFRFAKNTRRGSR